MPLFCAEIPSMLWSNRNKWRNTMICSVCSQQSNQLPATKMLYIRVDPLGCLWVGVTVKSTAAVG